MRTAPVAKQRTEPQPKSSTFAPIRAPVVAAAAVAQARHKLRETPRRSLPPALRDAPFES
jgi:hypothetical protein